MCVCVCVCVRVRARVRVCQLVKARSVDFSGKIQLSFIRVLEFKMSTIIP